jgi:uncharacterized membrane protein
MATKSYSRNRPAPPTRFQRRHHALIVINKCQVPAGAVVALVGVILAAQTEHPLMIGLAVLVGAAVIFCAWISFLFMRLILDAAEDLNKVANQDPHPDQLVAAAR